MLAHFPIVVSNSGANAVREPPNASLTDRYPLASVARCGHCFGEMLIEAVQIFDASIQIALASFLALLTRLALEQEGIAALNDLARYWPPQS